MFRLKTIIYIYLGVSILFTLNTLLLVLEHINSTDYQYKLLDFGILFTLVFFNFLISFRFNYNWANQSLSISKIVFYNIILLLGISLNSILIHYPIWTNLNFGKQSLDFFIRDEFIRNTIIILLNYLGVNFYVKNKKYQDAQNTMLLLKNENLQLQLTNLKQQLNPHFFFNSLNSLSELIYIDTEKSEMYIHKLSNVFRYILIMQETDMVSVKEELNFAEDFYYLLKVRFEDKVSLSIQCTINTEEYYLPTLCTQLLIENIIKHNKLSTDYPIEIHISVNEDYLTITNNINAQNTEDSFGIGLKNLNKRSSVIIGKPIVINRNSQSFSVGVPLIYKNRKT